MPKRFYKFKLLFDENMPPLQRFPRLNSRYDVKHVRDDLNKAGLKDAPVFTLGSQSQRIIITFNGADFYQLVDTSTETGIVNLSSNLTYEQIDNKLTSLLTKSTPKTLLGKYINLSGETRL